MKVMKHMHLFNAAPGIKASNHSASKDYFQKCLKWEEKYLRGIWGATFSTHSIVGIWYELPEKIVEEETNNIQINFTQMHDLIVRHIKLQVFIHSLNHLVSHCIVTIYSSVALLPVFGSFANLDTLKSAPSSKSIIAHNWGPIIDPWDTPNSYIFQPKNILVIPILFSMCNNIYNPC